MLARAWLRPARPPDHACSAASARRRPDPEFAKKELFHEIDGRPGYYVGAQVRYLDRAVLNVLHYDNRADPDRGSAGDSRLRVATRDSMPPRCASKPATAGRCCSRHSMATRSSIPASGSTGSSIRSPRCSPNAWARTCSRRVTTRSRSLFDGDPTGVRQRRRPRLGARVFVRPRRALALRARMAARHERRAGARRIARRTRVRHRIETRILGALSAQRQLLNGSRENSAGYADRIG